jgi:hypothetical protein
VFLPPGSEGARGRTGDWPLRRAAPHRGAFARIRRVGVPDRAISWVPPGVRSMGALRGMGPWLRGRYDAEKRKW